MGGACPAHQRPDRSQVRAFAPSSALPARATPDRPARLRHSPNGRYTVVRLCRQDRHRGTASECRSDRQRRPSRVRRLANKE